MRIFVVCSYYKPAYVYGGPVNALSSLCEELKKIGNEVTVFTTNANGKDLLNVPIGKRVEVEGVSVFYFPLLSNRLPYFYSPELSKAIKTNDNKFDFMIAEGLWDSPMIVGAKYAINHNIPYIVPIYGQLNPWAFSNKAIKKRFYLKWVASHYLNHAAGILCETPLEDEAVKKFGFISPNITIPSGLNTDFFFVKRNSGKIRQELGIPEDSPILLFLGRLAKIKRPDIAIEVLAFLQSINPEIHLILAGPDEDGLVKNLSELSVKLGCSDKVHFAGVLNRIEVRDVLSNSSLLLMPTEIQENFGNAALEALAASVPILVSDGVPLGKWAERYNAGRSVPCKKESFQKSAAELFQEQGLLTTMGENGKKFARNFFDMRVICQFYLDQFNSIINTGLPLPSSYFDQLNIDS